jgi:cadmium resistance protein CadD (predicted permease)
MRLLLIFNLLCFFVGLGNTIAASAPTTGTIKVNVSPQQPSTIKSQKKAQKTARIIQKIQKAKSMTMVLYWVLVAIALGVFIFGLYLMFFQSLWLQGILVALGGFCLSVLLWIAKLSGNPKKKS